MEEITLGPFDPSDINDLMTWLTDEQVLRFCTWDTCISREQGLNYLKDMAIPHPWLNNKPIGAILFTPFECNNRCHSELGYMLATKYWGQGIATQAVKMVVGSVFGEWAHLERLEALVDVVNVGSQKVFEGWVSWEGVLMKFYILKMFKKESLHMLQNRKVSIKYVRRVIIE